MIEWSGVVLLGTGVLLLANGFRGKPLWGFRAGLCRLSDRFLTGTNPSRLRKAEQWMEQAGRSKADVGPWFKLRKSAFLGAFFLSLLLKLLGAPLLPCASLALCAFLFPGFLLKRKIRRRKREILLTLPFYLDLLTLTLEAGLDLIASLEEIVRNDRPNALNEEIRILLASIRLGKTRSEAFQDLARRTDLEALSTFSGCVRQSEELGAGLGKLLRLQAEGLRRDLYREAEERAHKAPVRMLFPLILCIFPVMFLLLLVPIALRLAGTF